jgi:hypothetical protein
MDEGSPRIKLGRAYKHLGDLEEEVAALREKDPNRIKREVDTERREHRYRVEIIHPIPPEWGAIVGDFVSNLRSSLDHLVYVLPRTVAMWDESKTAFPIFTIKSAGDRNSATYDRRAANMLQNVIPEAEQIIERLQPYHRKRRPDYHPLAVLHDLWNADKHRALHVVNAHSTNTQSAIKISYGGTVRHHRGRIHHGDVIARYRLGRDPRSKIEGKDDFEIHPVLEHPGLVQGGRLLPALHHLYEFVSEQVFPPLEAL